MTGRLQPRRKTSSGARTLLVSIAAGVLVVLAGLSAFAEGQGRPGRPACESRASAGVPAARLAPFIADVEAARAQAPFGRAALAGTPLAAALDALLLPGDSTRPWRALINLQPPDNARLDVDRVRAAIADVPGVRVVARIDVAGGMQVASIAVGPDPRGVAVGDDAVWVAADDGLWRIDPKTNDAEHLDLHGAPSASLAAPFPAAGRIWVTVW